MQGNHNFFCKWGDKTSQKELGALLFLNRYNVHRTVFVLAFFVIYFLNKLIIV
jgi:hypothetical protein